MSIQQQLDGLKADIAGAYSAIEAKGGTIPGTGLENTSANLAKAIASIPAGEKDIYVVNAPIGAIMNWSGTEKDVPPGWHICDGEEGTLDLRDKFILGAGETHPVGETGGEEEVTLTVGQMPSHQHQYSYRSYSVRTDGSSTQKANVDITTGSDGNPVTGNYTGTAGSSQPHPNMPPYYALLFIQKISASPTDYVTEERMNEKIDEAIKNSNNNTPLSNDVYSTEETRIGTWIDGKPLYRKTFVLTTHQVSSTQIYSDVLFTEDDNVKMISAKGILLNPTGRSFAIPFYSTSGNNSVVTQGANGQIIVESKVSTDGNASGIVTLEYTKTTD